MPEIPTSDEFAARFWSKVEKQPDGCWLWTGARDQHGYGKVRFGSMKDGTRAMTGAHRMAWALTYGAWPERVLDHLCRVPPCINPDHLEDVAQRENLRRGTGWPGRNARVKECPQGHPYDEANTYVRASGARECRTCHREQVAAARRRR